MAVGKVTFTKTEREKLAEVLWLLNWISVVTGAILFSLGLYLKVEIQKWQEVMLEQSILYVPHMLIVTGLAACGINFMGGKICLDCADTYKFLRWKLVLMPYVICTFFFTSCVLAGALMCYTVRSQLEESLFLGLRSAMRFYKDTDTPGRCYLKRTVDLLQIEFQCCGNTGYRDWFQVQWISNRYLDMTSSSVVDRLRSNVDGRYLMDGVPFSCCSTLSPRPCIQSQLSNTSAHFNYDQQSQSLNLWRKGCRQALLDHYTGIMQSIGLTVLLIWMFELLVLTGVRYLQTAMENVIRLGDPDSESDGWILENSLVETARSNFDIIKNLGKCYQVDDDPNINVPSAAVEQEVPSRQVQKSESS
ncbi:photoreceptor outer segment membrane glycoprotein 2-like [Sphaeramia orbicularis]|uniref:Photoreceptor outer segment membrane glycoprotein 2-like n=1 Tax=Sphaeramia orbicularis TaxID=375764 RepID=A0A672ZSQ8_9TELE|nr:photoreceptor outer segment membrane glycoprotein 2-like [Sphaeramia orbicularis]XP_029985052.1 photoreceptor outer segment membrane glycoprotein 2-like [Sphaeramia orbicularis]